MGRQMLRTKRHFLLTVLISVFSAGWLAPLAWAAQSYLGYLNLVFLPKVRDQIPLTSAPLDNIALLQFYIACGWLFAVIAAWVYVGLRAGRSTAA